MPPLQMPCFPCPHPLTPSSPICLFSFCQPCHLCLPSHMSSLTHLFPHASSLTHLFPCVSLPSHISSLTWLVPHASLPLCISSLTWLVPHTSLPSHSFSLTHLVSSLAFVIPILAWMLNVMLNYSHPPANDTLKLRNWLHQIWAQPFITKIT